MSRYFTDFPVVRYNSVPVRDITRRTNFIRENLSNPFVFLPYTIKENERPEDIAFLYYGSVDYTWVVLLANEIYDPQNQWHLNEELFNELLIKKYKDVSGKTGYEVIDWTRNQTILENILYYEKDGIAYAPSTFPTIYEANLLGEFVLDENGYKIPISRTVPSDYIPVRIYDYEFQYNENKREITLVDKSYISQIEKEFRKKIKL